MDELDKDVSENIPANLLNYPIVLPTFQQIMALYNAILAANRGPGQAGLFGNTGNDILIGQQGEDV